MPLREKTFHQVSCDYPGCREEAGGDDYSWHYDEDQAVQAALDGDWYVENYWIVNDVKPEGPPVFLCPEHTVWNDEGTEMTPMPIPSDAYDWAIAIDRGPRDTYVHQSESEVHARIAQNLSRGWSLYRRVKREGPPAVSERAVDHGWEKVE
jgi:hypothetical protein